MTARRKREQLALAAFSASVSPTRDLFITRSPSSATGVSIHIVSAPDESRLEHDAKKEAAEILDALYALPVETRRELQLLLTEHADGFVGASAPKHVKKHPWPPQPRRPQ